MYRVAEENVVRGACCPILCIRRCFGFGFSVCVFLCVWNQKNSIRLLSFVVLNSRNRCVPMEFAHLNSILCQHFWKAWALWETNIPHTGRYFHTQKSSLPLCMTTIQHTTAIAANNQQTTTATNQRTSKKEKLFSKCSALKRIDSRIFFYMQSTVWNLIV